MCQYITLTKEMPDYFRVYSCCFFSQALPSSILTPVMAVIIYEHKTYSL